MLRYLVIGALLLFFFSRILPRLGSLLGSQARKPMRQAKWMWTWASGSEAEALAAELDYGQECAREFAAQFPQEAPARVQQLVEGIGATLAAAVKEPGRQFQFRAVVSPAANAYALPGGFIFVTAPLLALCAGDPDELAFVLGHEMAHVIRGHAREQLTTGVFLNAVTARLAGAGHMLREMLGKGYSRDLELEADREGAKLAARAGFDAHAGQRSLARLAAVSPEMPEWAEYLSSHPPFTERIAALQRRGS
jgi:beta-barrel assembly-enhancing protease